MIHYIPMKRYLLSFLEKHGSLSNLGFLFCINAIMWFLILPEASLGVILGSGQELPIDQWFFFSSFDFYLALSDYGEQGRRYYSFFLVTADLIFPFFPLVILFGCSDYQSTSTEDMTEDFVHTDTLTFWTDIAPIVFENCTPCHHENGAGPFSLTSFIDLKKYWIFILWRYLFKSIY